MLYKWNVGDLNVFNFVYLYLLFYCKVTVSPDNMVTSIKQIQIKFL